MQRPLYGLATDLTPFAVVGPAMGVPSLSGPGLAVPPAAPSAATASGASLRPMSQPRVPVSGRKEDPAIKVATIVVVAVLVAAWLHPTSRTMGSGPVDSVQEASVESVPSATSAGNAIAVKVEAKPIVRVQQPQRAAKRASQAVPWSPSEAPQSRSEPSDADLAATLQRLRGGM